MNNIYEVERDDYVGFVDQLLKSACSVRQENNEGTTWTKIFSKTSGDLLCVREIYNESGEEHYYIFNMPRSEERKTPPRKRKIILETKEEVQAFANILAQLTPKRDDVND